MSGQHFSAGRNPPNWLSWGDMLREEAHKGLRELPRGNTPTDVVLARLERLYSELGRVNRFEAAHPLIMTDVPVKSNYRVVNEVQVGGSILSLRAGPDGQLVCGTLNKQVIVWRDSDRLQEFESLAGHSGAVCALDLLPDGRFVTASTDSTARVWTKKRGTVWSSEPVPWAERLINQIQVLPGERLLAACDDGVVRLGALGSRQVEELKISRSNGVAPAPFSCVQALRDGRILGGRDCGDVTVWSPSTSGWSVTGFIAQRSELITCLGVLPDGRIVTGGSDVGLLVHERRDAVWEAKQVSVDGGGWINCLQVLPDGRIVFGTTRGALWITGNEPGQYVRFVGHYQQVRALQMLPDGKILTASDDGRVLVWDGTSEGPAAV